MTILKLSSILSSLQQEKRLYYCIQMEGLITMSRFYHVSCREPVEKLYNVAKYPIRVYCAEPMMGNMDVSNACHNARKSVPFLRSN